MNLLTKWNPFQPTRWDPFKELEDFERGLARLFRDSPAPPRNGDGDELTNMAAWAPLTDITEDDKEFLLKVELPDIKKDEVKVTVEDNTLRISGERKSEKEEKNKKYHRIERSYGSFLRAFSLPTEADGTKVSADFKDGMLTVHLPKTEEAKTKAIEVKVT